jgi:hypothetical protein
MKLRRCLKKTKMTYKKIKTNVVIPPDLFYKKPCCLYCGIWGQKVCDECSLKVFEKCKICEIILRDEPVWRYTYSALRKIGFDPILKRYALEELKYEVPVIYKKHSKDMCEQCVGWEDRVSNICWRCKKEMLKLKNHYSIKKLQKRYVAYGNLCLRCQRKMGILDKKI